MWLLKLLAVFIQISALLALGHPGKFHSIYFILAFEFPIIFKLNLSTIQLRFLIVILISKVRKSQKEKKNELNFILLE